MVKAKLKPILPSLKEKKRYLVFEVISPNKIINANFVSDVIFEASHKFFGYLGAAKAGLMVLNNKWNEEKQRGILKVGHKYVDEIKASFISNQKRAITNEPQYYIYYSGSSTLYQGRRII